MISAKDGRVGTAPRKNGKTLDRRSVILGVVLMATGWQAFAQDGLFNYQEYEKRVKSAQILAVKLLMPIVLLLGLPALPGITLGGESQALHCRGKGALFARRILLVSKASSAQQLKI